jgi:PEP-CTERM motif
MIKSTKAFLLAGASALAILASAAEANAETFTAPGKFFFIPSVSGEYAIGLLGASGGNSSFFDSVGGLGAEASGYIFLTAGEELTLFAGEQGGSGTYAGGGGGGSFVFRGTDVLAAAGGGGGGGGSDGNPGLAGTSGRTGEGDGGAGGVGGTGGGGGGISGGGGGAGVNAGPAGHGGDGRGSGGFGGKFPNGGAGGAAGSYGAGGGSGGYGGGGGGGGNGYGAGGGGSGFSGGGGGGDGFGGGGGGGSYLASLFKDQVLKAGVNSGDGSISIALLEAAVPEPSTWAMMLAGFGGLGWLAQARRRKTSPA